MKLSEWKRWKHFGMDWQTNLLMSKNIKKWVKQTDRQTDKTSFKNYYRSYFYSKLVLFLSCVLFITEEKVLTIDTFLVSGGIFTLFSWTFTSTSKSQKSLKRILFFLLVFIQFIFWFFSSSFIFVGFQPVIS